MNTRIFLSLTLALFFLPGYGPAAAQEPQLEVGGVYGIDNQEGNGFLAVRIPLPENTALSGVLWYNNDMGSPFPTLRVGTGFPEWPGEIGDFLPVRDQVGGISSGWSEVQFDQPVGASLGSLYVAFELPENHGLSGRGTGGGAGVGYFENRDGLPGWISGEGMVWAKLHEDYSFAVIPLLVPLAEGMAVKSLGSGAELPPVPTENYLLAAPNPFNPETTLSFGLKRAGEVKIQVFDVRGRHVTTLFQGFLEAGRHVERWRGRDEQGKTVASGVYFCVLEGGDLRLSQKLLLLK